MDENRYIHRALRLRESPMSRRLVRSMKESLFLEDDAISSRLEAYDPNIFALNLEEVARFSSASETVEAKTNSFGNEQDEFRVTEIIRLRTSNELADYVGRTKAFRAFFIRQTFSWAPLSITRSLFQALLSNARVMLPVEQYVLYYGIRSREVEIMPPRLKHRVLQPTQRSPLGGYEYLYGVRFFENNGRGSPKQPTEQWSLRQSAIYNRFEPEQSGAIWIFITLSKHAQSRIDDYVVNEKDLQAADPLEIHLLVLDTALATWRPYLIDLSTEVDEHTAQVAGMSPDDQGPISLSDATIGDITLLDEKLLNALLVARAQLDTIQSLRMTASNHAGTLQPDPKFTQCVLQEQLSDLELYIVQLNALRTKLSSASTLLSSFLDLGSGLALQNLARESRQENEEMRRLSERMHELTEKATKDAAAVKVLTILTLIYLPATVVSNFFSTSFVGTEGPSNHITVSNDWWIFVAVSIPLTAFTLYVWYVWKNQQADGAYPLWWRFFTIRKTLRRSAASDDPGLLPEEKV